MTAVIPIPTETCIEVYKKQRKNIRKCRDYTALSYIIHLKSLSSFFYPWKEKKTSC